MKALGVAVLVAALTTICVWDFSSARAQDKSEQSSSKKTIRGLVRDIACPLQNKESTSRRFNLECAKMCAAKGSPLAILTDDGTLYFAIAAGMPDTDQRPRLLPFLGKYVSVSGDVFERAGTHAIIISEIKEDKSVHLDTGSSQPE